MHTERFLRGVGRLIGVGHLALAPNATRVNLGAARTLELLDNQCECARANRHESTERYPIFTLHDHLPTHAESQPGTVCQLHTRPVLPDHRCSRARPFRGHRRSIAPGGIVWLTLNAAAHPQRPMGQKTLAGRHYRNTRPSGPRTHLLAGPALCLRCPRRRVQPAAACPEPSIRATATRTTSAPRCPAAIATSCYAPRL
jgi:hypothetical protein